MSYKADPAYSLSYGKDGSKEEVNLISDLLTDPDFSIEEVSESIRAEFQIMREAIEIAHKYKYDMDFFTENGVLEVAIYKKFSGPTGLTPLMPLFSKANSVNMYNYKPGNTVMLSALYLFTSKPKEG